MKSPFTPREEFYDKPLRGEGHMSRWAGNLIYWAGYIIFGIMFRWRIYGRENLDVGEGKAAVLAGNHMSMLDPFFAIFATHNNVRFIAKAEALGDDAIPIVAQGEARIGVIPINRNTADRTAIKRAVSAIKRGEYVGIYPQGTRTMPWETREYHAGAVLIAQMAKCPIIPMGVSGSHKIRPKGQKLMHFPKVVLRIGKPIDPHLFDVLPKKARAQACTEEVMRHCLCLRDGIDPGEVQIVLPVGFEEEPENTRESGAKQPEGEE